MSAFRRLTSSLRSERRCEQACPYSRPQPSPPKPKPTRRPRYWDFFNFFSFAAPYTDEEEEEAKRQAEAKAKASKQTEVIVASEQDSEMSDASVSASSTEESTTTTSDSSLETVETAETSERAELVEPAKLSEPVQPMQMAESIEPARPKEPLKPEDTAMPAEPVVSLEPVQLVNSVSSQFVSSVPLAPQSSNRPDAAISAPTCSPPAVPMSATSDDEILEWARLKFESGTPFNDMDVLGLKAFLDRRREGLPFEPIKLRFPRQFYPATISPVSEASPDVSSSQHSAFSSSTSLPTFKNNVPPRPPRMLKVDPNGPLELRGAGSARVKPDAGRKRPAPVVKMRFDPYKRCRLFEEAMEPSLRGNGVTSRSVPIYTEGSRIPTGSSRVVPNRQRVASPSPSPLRNVISVSPSPVYARSTPTNLSATSSRSAHVVPANQTASAAFLQEAVEKVAPKRPRYSDVVNPYQTAAPVKPIFKPMEKKRLTESRARTKETGKQKEAAGTREKRELTAKEIIEATVPKGAKRSRPPPGLTKSKVANITTGSAGKRVLEDAEEGPALTKKRRTVTVEEVSEDDDNGRRSFPVRPNVIIESRSPSPEPTPAPSRPPAESSLGKELSAKTSSVKGAPQKTTPIVSPPVKEVAKAFTTRESSVKVPAAKEQGSKSHPPGKGASSKESSTRVSSKGSSARGPSNHFSPLLNSKVTGKSSVPREPSKLRTSFLPDECENEEPKMASPTPSAVVTMTTPGTPLADIQEKKDPKEVALTLPLNDLPSFIFKTPPALMAGDHTDARVAAKELPVTSLPKFDFSKARSAMNGIIFPAVPIPTIKPFDFESAGVKPKTSACNGRWQCLTCMLQNSACAVEKCSICEAPRPDATQPNKAAVNGINGANGGKNLSSVNGKVPSPKASPTSTTSRATEAFDFAAAGLMPNSPVIIGQWTCPACMLQNPPSATEKCKVCDSPRPEVEKTKKEDKPKKPCMNGTSHSSSKLTNGLSRPIEKSFDFAAAGIPPKESSTGGNWHCSTCMLQNPASALEKCKVCDSPRPGMEKKAAPLPVVPVKSIPQLVPKSFDWAAAGIVPKLNASSWTCGTCMLSNPPTETEKCKICDASRS